MDLEKYFDWEKIKEAEPALCRDCDSLEEAISRCVELHDLFSLWRWAQAYERGAMGAALSSKIQVLTSGPYLSSENDLSLPEGGRFVLCDAHTGDIPESWRLEDLEKLMNTQYSKLTVEPAFFLDMTLFYCPFEYHRIIYTKEILGDGVGLSNQEDKDPFTFDDIF